MGRDGAHALDLVSRDGDPEARAADKQGPVHLALGHESRRIRRAQGVRRLVVCRQAADVRYGLDARVGFEVSLDFVLVVYARVLKSGRERERLADRYS